MEIWSANIPESMILEGEKRMSINVNNNIVPKESGNEILLRYYTYKDGKGQEKVIHKTDCVEFQLESITVPEGSENYNDIVNQMKTFPLVPSNKMFYETMDVMKDYYAGKLTEDEVKNIYKEYCYHMFGTPDLSAHPARKTQLTNALADMYEYFSRANTRAAVAMNVREGAQLAEANDVSIRGGAYYNSEYYDACNKMQDMFREISNELSEEYGAAKVDFTYIEEHTKFTLDGGITFNGVWLWSTWQTNRDIMEAQVPMKKSEDDPQKKILYMAGTAGKRFDLENLRKSIEALFKGQDDSFFENLLIKCAAGRVEVIKQSS